MVGILDIPTICGDAWSTLYLQHCFLIQLFKWIAVRSSLSFHLFYLFLSRVMSYKTRTESFLVGLMFLDSLKETILTKRGIWFDQKAIIYSGLDLLGHQNLASFQMQSPFSIASGTCSSNLHFHFKAFRDKYSVHFR